MLVSVIINTKNEENNLEKCLKSVVRQSFSRENFEIIVVDNGSSDKTKEIARKYADKVLNQGPERSAQKNLGVRQAKGEFFIHLDADMMLSENVISECVQKISGNSDIVSLYIPEKIMGRGFWGKVRNFERSFYDRTVIDAVRFIRKDKFLEAGGFDEKMYACEDWDLDKRLKNLGKFGIIESPIRHNEEAFSFKGYLAKKKYYSKNVKEYIGKWGKGDRDVKKQFGLYYRFFGVFMENGKWKKFFARPVLASGTLFLKILVGITYLKEKYEDRE